MGVMNCSRRGCDRVMCDRLSHTYGYICDECFSELVSLGKQQNVEKFLNTPKGNYNEDPVDAVDYFDSIFPIPEEW